jgi:hypothetical protein
MKKILGALFSIVAFELLTGCQALDDYKTASRIDDCLDRVVGDTASVTYHSEDHKLAVKFGSRGTGTSAQTPFAYVILDTEKLAAPATLASGVNIPNPLWFKGFSPEERVLDSAYETDRLTPYFRARTDAVRMCANQTLTSVPR